jgi:hypothetical protein
MLRTRISSFVDPSCGPAHGQALYGRTGALYSRFELIRSLGLQKDHARFLVDEMIQQEMAVNEMAEAMDGQAAMVSNKGLGLEERKYRRVSRPHWCSYWLLFLQRLHVCLSRGGVPLVQIRHFEDGAKRREEEVILMQMAVSNAEQEVVRMQSLVDCVCGIYPSAVAHVMRHQPDFNFRERGLSEVSRFRLKQEQEKFRIDKINGQSETRPPDDTTVGTSQHGNSTLSTSLDVPGGQSSAASGSNDSPGQGQGRGSAAGAQLALLHDLPLRVQWVLSVTDFRDILAARTTMAAAATTAAMEGTEEEPGGKDEDYEALIDDAVRLYGLFEFMRTGKAPRPP